MRINHSLESAFMWSSYIVWYEALTDQFDSILVSFIEEPHDARDFVSCYLGQNRLQPLPSVAMYHVPHQCGRALLMDGIQCHDKMKWMENMKITFVKLQSCSLPSPCRRPAPVVYRPLFCNWQDKSWVLPCIQFTRSCRPLAAFKSCSDAKTRLPCLAM